MTFVMLAFIATWTSVKEALSLPVPMVTEYPSPTEHVAPTEDVKSFVGPNSERAATVASIPREELGPLERPTPRVESVACSTRYAVNSSLVPPNIGKRCTPSDSYP